MNFKQVIFALSILATYITTPAFAYQNATQGQMHQQQIEMITTKLNGLFQLVNEAAKANGELKKNQFDQYFTDDTKYSVNGKILYTGREGVYAHFMRIKQNGSFSVQIPIEIIPAARGNMATLFYTVNVTGKDGVIRKDFTMSLLTFKNGKISNWSSVDSNAENEINSR